MNTVVENGHKVCKITLVNTGISDKVIKVYPAKHESEKIWLNEVKGIERWDMIKRNMNAYAERGTRVPDPVPYHNDPKNLVNVTLKEDDIPLVRMDGWILPAPIPDEVAPIIANDANNVMALNKRIGNLENSLGSLAQTLSLLVSKISLGESPKPSKQTDDLASREIPCDLCPKKLKTSTALKAHKTRMHKGK